MENNDIIYRLFEITYFLLSLNFSRVLYRKERTKEGKNITRSLTLLVDVIIEAIAWEMYER